MVITLAVSSIRHFYSNASQCIFDDNADTGTIPIPIFWVLVVDSINGVGVVLTTCSSLEFVMAQTPNKRRGIIVGIFIAVGGFNVLGNCLLTTLLPNNHSKLCVLLLPGTIPAHTVDTSSVCYSSQALQAEKEGQAHQHTPHSGGTLCKVL